MLEAIIFISIVFLAYYFIDTLLK